MKILRKFIKTTILECLNENQLSNNLENDKVIYNLISDWIISSLDDTQKRQKIGERLMQLNIPQEYKYVPSNTVFRVGKSSSKFVSYSYDYKGLKKMINWYKQIFKKTVEDSDIVEKNIDEISVLICIPTFLKKTGFSSGKRFDAIWKSEYEVICIN